MAETPRKRQVGTSRVSLDVCERCPQASCCFFVAQFEEEGDPGFYFTRKKNRVGNKVSVCDEVHRLSCCAVLHVSYPAAGDDFMFIYEFYTSE